MSTVQIPLTKGQFATIDQKHFELISQYKWQAHWAPNTKSFYASGIVKDLSTGKNMRLPMHRYILGVTDSKVLVDHINHDTLNNTEANLRPVTRSQNNMNRRKSENTSSLYKGTSWHKQKHKWMSYIRINKKRKFLGYFESETEAALCYNANAVILFGSYALLNIIN